MDYSQLKANSVILFFIGVLLVCPLSGEEDSPPEDVERIIILAEKESLDPESTSAQVTVITADQIKEMGARNAAEIVATAPGVIITSYGARSQSQQISIRGSNADQVLVMINGKKMNTAQGGGVDLSLINPDNIDRIEIIRGGMSAVYGDGAFGGVVNIVLKEGSNKNLEIAITYGFSSFMTHDLSFLIQRGLGKKDLFDFSIALNGFYTNGEYDYYSSDYDKVLSRENAEGLGGGGSFELGWDIIPESDMRLTLDGQVQASEKGIPGMEQFASVNAQMEDTSVVGSLNYSWMQNPLASIEIDLSAQHNLRHYTDPDWYLDPVDDTHINNSINSGISLSRQDFIGSQQMKNSVDFSFRNDHLDSSALVFSDSEGSGIVEKKTSSLFYRSDIFLFPFRKNSSNYKIIVSPSLRYDSLVTESSEDDSNNFEDKVSWNAGWMINLDSELKYFLKGNIGTAYHLPTFGDLFWPETGFAMGNPDLKPENAFNIDAGIIAKPFSFLSLELVYYRQVVEELIQWTSGPGGVWRPRNIGEALLTGIETEIKTFIDIPLISCILETSGNYSLLISQNKEEGIALYDMQLLYRPKHQYNLSTTLKHYNGHSLNISGAYTGYRYTTEGNTKYIDQHFLLNATLFLAISDSFEVSLYGKNLLNQSYIDRLQYPVPGSEFGFKTRYKY